VILVILKIRGIQIFRLLKEIGLLRALILFVILAFASLLLFQAIKRVQGSGSISLIAGIAVLMIHASRKDKRFIKINFRNGYFIFLIEYLILMFPLICVCCIFQDWKNSLILIIVCSIVPRIYMNLGLRNSSSSLKFLLKPFHLNLQSKFTIGIPIRNPKSFEWISGLRRNFIIFVPLYILFLVFSFNAYVGPVGLIVLSLFVSGFYFYGESREFIILFSRNYKTFIFQKIKASARYLMILSIPIAIVSLAFHWETWYYVTGAIIISILIQAISIIFKYALFDENTDLGRNGIIVYFNVACILIPFLWPLSLIMGIRYYFKAQNNLKKYLE
jgi:hypothetical protein